MVARLEFRSDAGTQSYLVNEAILQEMIQGCAATLAKMRGMKH
jgi:hypothetical protein